MKKLFGSAFRRRLNLDFFIKKELRTKRNQPTTSNQSADHSNQERQKESTTTETATFRQNSMPEIETHLEEIETVKSVIIESASNYRMIPCGSYHSPGCRKSKMFDSYHILCHSEPTIPAGWLIYNHIMNGFCNFEDRIKRYTDVGGTTSFHRHDEKNNSQDPLNSFQQAKISGPPKDQIMNAAAYVTILDYRPLNFCEHQEGMLRLASALIKVGQNIPLGREVDVSDVLPRSKTISKEVCRISSACKLEIKQRFRIYHR